MKNSVLIVITALLLLNLCYSGYLHYRLSGATRIGVVRMDQLVYAYAGMQDASQVYADQMVLWSRQADSLQGLLQTTYKNFHRDSSRRNTAVLPAYKQDMQRYRSQLVAFQQNIKQAAAQKDQHMTQGVLNQIRAHIQSYGEEFHYDVLIATRETQDLSYVRQATDLTDEILEYANEKYRRGE